MRTYPLRALLCLLILLLFSYGSPAAASEPDTDLTGPAITRQLEDRRTGDALRFASAVQTYADAVNSRLRCPVPGSTFIASFGAPRDGHTHQGTDMMAPDGTPIYAPQAGTYRQHGNDSFYLDGLDGTQWFGTHLQEHVHADGLVAAGDLIALVGHTGNASPDAPHLHLELHPGGGAAVEGYPVLEQACRAPDVLIRSSGAAMSRTAQRPYYSAPRPTFPFGVMEVHLWVNSTRAQPDRINRRTATQVTRYLNAIVVNYLRKVMAAQAIPYEANWDRVAACESGGNWSINTGNGYYGGVQFSLATWQSVGGSGYPHQNSKAEQIRRAEILRQRAGLGQWPVCGSRWYG